MSTAQYWATGRCRHVTRSESVAPGERRRVSSLQLAQEGPTTIGHRYQPRQDANPKSFSRVTSCNMSVSLDAERLKLVFGSRPDILEGIGRAAGKVFPLPDFTRLHAAHAD